MSAAAAADAAAAAATVALHAIDAGKCAAYSTTASPACPNTAHSLPSVLAQSTLTQMLKAAHAAVLIGLNHADELGSSFATAQSHRVFEGETF